MTVTNFFRNIFCFVNIIVLWLIFAASLCVILWNIFYTALFVVAWNIVAAFFLAAYWLRNATCCVVVARLVFAA